MDVVLKDFQPINSWTPDLDGPTWQWGECRGEPKFLIDSSTNRKYFNECRGIVRVKSFLLTMGTPIVHVLAAVRNVAFIILKIMILVYFWIDKDGEDSYNFKARLTDVGIDLLRIIATPLAIIGLECAAIYGVFRPYDGRKLYATIERAEYDSYILAPCFQPDPKRHAFGGDVNTMGAF